MDRIGEGRIAEKRTSYGLTAEGLSQFTFVTFVHSLNIFLLLL